MALDVSITAAQFQPLQSFMLVRRDEVETKLANGLVLPESSKVPATTGRILSTGPDAPASLGVGTRILFGKYAGTEIKLDGTDYLIINDKEVIAVIKDIPVAAAAEVANA